MQVNVSLSTTKHQTKPTSKEWANMHYEAQKMEIRDFYNKILQGHAYTSIYNKDNFKTTEKTKDNWIGTQMLVYDIDNILPTYNNLFTYLRNCQRYPTIAYITPSHLKADSKGEMHARFRLIYVLDFFITDPNTYKQIYEIIESGLPKQFEDPNKPKDNCGKSPYQQFGGNAHAREELGDYFNEGRILHLSGFSKEYKGTIEASEADAYIKERQEVTKNLSEQQPTKIAGTQQSGRNGARIAFYEDITTLSPLDFIHKYARIYERIESTQIDFNGELWKETPKGYAEIQRKYTITEDERGNKRVSIKVYKDGEQRRKTMYIHSLLRKQIKPNTSREELIYNLLWDRLYFYDNSDNKLNNNTLQQIAENALKANYTIAQIKQKKYKINKELCRVRGISTKAIVRKAAKEIHYKEIGEIYDISKSVMQNLKELNEQGIKVCRKTLYNFCKDMGINPKGTEWKPKSARMANITTIKKTTMKERESTITLQASNGKKYVTTWQKIINHKPQRSVLLTYCHIDTKEMITQQRKPYIKPSCKVYAMAA